MKQTGQTRVMDMSLCECMKKKLQQATCDKIGLEPEDPEVEKMLQGGREGHLRRVQETG